MYSMLYVSIFFNAQKLKNDVRLMFYKVNEINKLGQNCNAEKDSLKNLWLEWSLTHMNEAKV